MFKFENVITDLKTMENSDLTRTTFLTFNQTIFASGEPFYLIITADCETVFVWSGWEMRASDHGRERRMESEGRRWKTQRSGAAEEDVPS